MTSQQPPETPTTSAGRRFRPAAISALGLNYLSINLVWALYNSYLPIFYAHFLQSNFLIGLAMTIDNVAQLTWQPLAAGLSDRVRTPWGSRVPFVVLGFPVAAVFLLLIPGAPSLIWLLVATVLTDTGMVTVTGPTIALMPDITPEGERGRANGIITAAGGLGALVAFFVGSALYRRNPLWPFILGAVVLVLAAVVTLVLVRERRYSARYQELAGSADGLTGEGDLRLRQRGGTWALARTMLQPEQRPLLLLLASVFGWVAAVNGAQNLFTRFATVYWHLDAASAALSLGFFALSFIVFAVPAGALSSRFGAARLMSWGMLGLLLAFLVIPFLAPGLPVDASLVFAGFSYALATVNAYPLVVKRAGSQTGAYTGLYYVVEALAGIVSPPLYGLALDTLGPQGFFIPGLVFLALAWLALRAFQKQPPLPAAGT